MMVPSKKTATALPNGTGSNGTNRKDSPNSSHYQKRDTMAGKADGKSQNGNFRTDTAISGNRAGEQRVLQRWQPDAPPSNVDHSLEKSGGGSWNQFEANERLFGLKTDYDEHMYTTQIDKSHPRYKERMAAAEKKAKEIEKSVASTSHVAEERVMDFVGGDNGGDEEDKYSGVKRQQQNDFPPLPGGRENKYTPPARRAPTGSATVKGAPFDPAIISSQLKSHKPATAAKPADDSKTRTAPTETAAPAGPAAKPAEPKSEAAAEASQKTPDTKAAPQAVPPLKPSTSTARTVSPQNKDAAPAPNATSTVERDVLNSFKAFASQQRDNAERARSSKAKADKQVKLTELKKFASSFKLPTPVPVDLIGIIAKDPAKQKAIQEKAARDAAECQRQKEEDKVASQKKQVPTPKDGQAGVSSQTPQNDRTRTGGAPSSAQPAAAAPAARHPGPRSSYVPQAYPPFRNGASHMGPPGGRQSQGLAARIQNNQKMGGDMRQPPTGPANVDPSFGRRGPMPAHINKLNPNSHEFRPSPFAASFSPNGHPSAGSSPKSALNNVDPNAASNQSGAVTFITKKKTVPNPKKCNVLSYLKNQKKPEGKNWADNDGFKPPYDTAPAWRQTQDDEKPDSTMRYTFNEYMDRIPFIAQPTPNPSHALPQLAHQHQLPFHLQQGAHNVGPRASPHVPPVPMHPGQHGPMTHGPFNGADDHRMMHSNSSQSYSSPRVGPVSAAYPPNMNAPGQMPYAQNGMPFMTGNPQQMGYNPRSFSNQPGYMPHQGVPMGTPVMMQPQFVTSQGMPGGQMQMYGAPPFMPPGAVPQQPMPGANGYPSPGRPAATMMVPQGSQSGQPIYGMSPGMQYQQPVFPQQAGQMNNMRGFSNQGYQQYGSSPQQMHQYSQQHRNGSNNFNNKNFQGHNQHQPPQAGHPVPSVPHGRTPEGADEAK